MANCRKCKKILTVGEIIQYDGLCMNCISSIRDFVDNQPTNVGEAPSSAERSVNTLLCADLPLLNDKFVKSVVKKYWGEPVPDDWDSPKYTCTMPDIKQIIELAIKEYVNLVKE